MLIKKGYLVIRGDRAKGYPERLSDIDCVIHLAAKVHDFNENSYGPYYESNVRLTQELLERAIKSDVKKFIFLSSIKVNGEESDRPYSDTKVDCPKDLYGRSKWEAEKVVRNLCADKSTFYTIIRPPLIFGPNVKANFKRLVKIALKPIPLPFGEIKEKRSFIYVENLSDLLIKCIDEEKSHNRTFLVRDNTNLSTSELISMIRKINGSKRLIFNLPLSILQILFKVIGKDSFYTRLANGLSIDDSSTREEIQWEPPVNTKDAIQATLSSFK
ncbi:MAG: NAD-dependent epimerase/dehydratase family protein [Bacteriovoracaceae bacterium]|nr:NAD-dependent epimerase/dehydratase family protein [Bacteriovoracaceae bacterium]